MAHSHIPATAASFDLAVPHHLTSTRPLLLPANRKLRNLVSVSLRNLNLLPASASRSRGKPIDDDALPQALKSPVKLFALRDRRSLGHSKSSTDLRAVAEEDPIATNPTSYEADSTDANGSLRDGIDIPPIASERSLTPKKPELGKLRRRSTVEWANATAQKRQERLDDVTRGRMADVFFSLHVAGIEEPVYISEAITGTMNPTFRRVDWSANGPGITRCEKVTLRVWAKGGTLKSWRQLLEFKLNMRALHYLGKSLDHLDRPLPQNAVLIHFNNGIFTSFADSLSEFIPPGSAHLSEISSHARLLPTSSFDALLRLSKLDDSIQDALATRNQIASDLEKLICSNKQALDDEDDVVAAADRLKTIEYAKKIVEKQMDKVRRQHEETRASIASRRQNIASDISSRHKQKRRTNENTAELITLKEEHLAKVKATQNQRRRICEELQQCYSVQPLPERSLAFTIQGLHLPNADDLDKEPAEVVSAALGHVAHVLEMLSFYLEQTLPYPVTPHGSTSTIYDPISILKTNTPFTTYAAEQGLRTYPLFSKSTPRFRFEYAVFLLNQNIRAILEATFDLRVMDIRQTLPNLKYLLYVATAGEGELPARKAGGIRGLTRGPARERTGSPDSMGSGLSGLTLAENGKPRPLSGLAAAERLREIGSVKSHGPAETLKT